MSWGGFAGAKGVAACPLLPSAKGSTLSAPIATCMSMPLWWALVDMRGLFRWVFLFAALLCEGLKGYVLQVPTLVSVKKRRTWPMLPSFSVWLRLGIDCVGLLRFDTGMTLQDERVRSPASVEEGLKMNTFVTTAADVTGTST